MKPQRAKNIHQINHLAMPDFRTGLICELLFGKSYPYRTETIILDPTLLNGGFESSFTDWGQYQPAQQSIEATIVKSGTKALKIVNAAVETNSNVYQTILTVGHYYKIEFWARNANGANGKVRAILGDVLTNIKYDTGVLTNAYVNHTGYFVADQTKLRLAINGINSTVYIDDITITDLVAVNSEPDTSGNSHTAAVSPVAFAEVDAVLGKYCLRVVDKLAVITPALKNALNIGVGTKTFVSWIYCPTIIASSYNNLFWFDGACCRAGVNLSGGKRTPYLYLSDVDEVEELEIYCNSDVVNAAEWMMISIIVDYPNKTVELYVNATLVRTKALDPANSGFQTAENFYIGNDASESFNSCDRSHALLRIYNAHLTADQIEHIYFYTRRAVLGLPPKP